MMSIPMGELSLPDQDGVSRSISESPPNHYVVKIQSFSLLEKNKIEKYVSNDFQAGGYKWKLVIYPNGNKSKGINDHVSMYLMLAEGNSLLPGWEIRAIFRLFLLDQNKDTYLTVQDASSSADKGGKRFHSLKNEWGFDKLIPHASFNEAASGYLVNDVCVFGAEVYVCSEKHTGKGERVSMIKDAVSYKSSWRIENYSSLNSQNEGDCVDSKTFNAAGQKWKMQLYPKGKGSGVGSHISLYLTLAEPEDLSPASKIYAEFTLRILDQNNRNNYYGTANYWFTASNSTCGWPRFVSYAYFNLSTTGLLVKNVCIVEVEVTVHGVVSDAL